MSRLATRLGLLASTLALAGCGGTTSPGTEPGEPVTLTVYAASSLKESFTELGRRFEADNGGVEVAFNFAGSSDLVAQIQQGAPADVFAAADEKNMDKLIADKLVDGTAEPFASNTLQIAVPPDDPARVSGLKDLGSPSVDVVVCAPEVPCGAAATRVAEIARVTFHTVSEEQNVTDVLSKVTSGQAEAGLVYVTDIKAAGDDVKGIHFPESDGAVNVYPIAAVKGSKHAADARAFAELVLGPVGQEVLRDAGFAKP